MLFFIAKCLILRVYKCPDMHKKQHDNNMRLLVYSCDA